MHEKSSSNSEKNKNNLIYIVFCVIRKTLIMKKNNKPHACYLGTYETQVMIASATMEIKA